VWEVKKGKANPVQAIQALSVRGSGGSQISVGSTDVNWYSMALSVLIFCEVASLGLCDASCAEFYSVQTKM